MRTAATMLATASVSVLGACGGGGSTPSVPSTPAPTPAARAEVSVTISPASPVAQPTGDGTYPWNSFGFEAPGALNYGADEIIRHAGRNHLGARGELQIPLGMRYRADRFGGRTITLKNAVSFTDDRGNQMMLGATATVVSEITCASDPSGCSFLPPCPQPGGDARR